MSILLSMGLIFLWCLVAFTGVSDEEVERDRIRKAIKK